MPVHSQKASRPQDPIQDALAQIRRHKSPADTQRYIMGSPAEFIAALAVQRNPALSTRNGVLEFFRGEGCPIDGSSANQLAMAIDAKRKRAVKRHPL